MKYCLCSTKDGISLTLGLVSVLSWGVAEIPQIITSYKEKSAEGLSIAFLMTWIVGDLLNLFGCMLEPATLPTQYYMAMLYTLTTTILTSQTIYYSHIYHRIKSKIHCHKEGAVKKERQCSYSDRKKEGDDEDGGGKTSIAVVSGVTPSSPIPLPAGARNGSVERESYYMSARSLTRSHTPTVGFYRVQRRSTSVYEQSSVEEPLLGGPQSAPHSNPKTMLCVVFAVTFFLGTYNLQLEKISRLNMVSESNQGVVMLVGRKLLQISGSLTEGTGTENIGTFLGWGMAAIYMGGRLPQICLNIRRGNVQGLNPFMFVFALVGNATYVASILVSSLEWSKIRPNLPWLVDAGGCVVLDTFIIIQFIYFNSRTRRGPEEKTGTPTASR